MAVRIESQAEPIPGYKLIDRLGGGGFGDVWKAEAPGGVLKAIKFVFGNLKTVDQDGAKAEQELKALSRVKTVRHPFILALDRYDIIDGQLMIVMELADCNLWDHFLECRDQGHHGIPREELLDYMMEAAEALDLMNLKYDLQHLDIKPQNLFLVHNHVKVADFGMVKDLEGLAATVTGGVTPVYAAPETFEGWVSRYSDQYSLGIVYQELLTAQRPFAGTNTRQLIMQHLQGQPNLEPLPACDRPMVARSLSKKPEDRFPSCLEFIRALRKADRRDAGAMGRADAEGPVAFQAEPAGRETPPSATGVTPVPREAARTPPPTPRREVIVEEQEAEQPAAPPRVEERGDGVLMPALVVGLGYLGLEVLRQVRKDMQVRFGDVNQVGNVRLLYVDTDSEALDASYREVTSDIITPEEVVLARLNRPGRYLRARDLPPVENWLDPKMIYRIPRSLVTTGIRALGRLALIDNYRGIHGRLTRDLERITAAETLKTASQHTGLSLRSNYPRVYVVTSLAGGTGSGMFLDVAYVVKSMLRDMGFTRQEVIGVLLLPCVEETPDQGVGLANAVASLRELNHFATSEEVFQAAYDMRAGPVRDKEPPFQRCVLVSQPSIRAEGALRPFADRVAECLFRDLLTPLGKEADAMRTEQAQAGRPSEGIGFQCFGLKVISSPRNQVLRRSGIVKRLCKQTAEQWLAKAKTRSQTGVWERAIREEVAEQLKKLHVEPTGLMDQLQSACAKELQMAPDKLFASWQEPINALEAPQVPDSSLVRQVIRNGDELLGHPPHVEAKVWRTPRIQAILRDAADYVVKRAVPGLAPIVMHYVNQPGYRLGGAEEAVRQSIACLEEWITQFEKQGEHVGLKMFEVMEQLQEDMVECDRCGGKLRSSARAKLMSRLSDHLLSYPLIRFQQVLLEHINKMYMSLRGYLSDQMKSLSFHRQRLQELQKQFQDTGDSALIPGAGEAEPMADAYRSIVAAIEQVAQAITPEEKEQLEAGIHTAIQERFGGLLQVCSSTGPEPIRELQSLMQHQVVTFLDRRVLAEDVVDLFFKGKKDAPALADEIVHAFEQACPVLDEKPPPFEWEIGIVMAPNSASGQKFLDLVRRALPDVKAVATEASDEIVIYREYAGLALEDLPQIGKEGREAYQKIGSLEHFTPHTRLDIQWKELV